MDPAPQPQDSAQLISDLAERVPGIRIAIDAGASLAVLTTAAADLDQVAYEMTMLVEHSAATLALPVALVPSVAPVRRLLWSRPSPPPLSSRPPQPHPSDRTTNDVVVTTTLVERRGCHNHVAAVEWCGARGEERGRFLLLSG